MKTAAADAAMTNVRFAGGGALCSGSAGGGVVGGNAGALGESVAANGATIGVGVLRMTSLGTTCDATAVTDICEAKLGMVFSCSASSAGELNILIVR